MFLVAVLLLFCGYDHTANPEEVCVVKGNTLRDISSVAVCFFVCFFLISRTFYLHYVFSIFFSFSYSKSTSLK